MLLFANLKSKKQEPGLCILIYVLCSVLLAQAQFRKVATTGYAFLEIPVSARMVGMGELSTVLTDIHAESVFGNPGQLGFMAGRHGLFLSYASYLAETKHQALAYVYNHPWLGTLGISLALLDMGSMTETINADPNNPGGSYLILGKFEAAAVACGLTYSRRLTDLFAFGISIKYVRESIGEYLSDNWVFDMGMMYHTGFRSLRIGGYIQHFGVDAKYFDDTFKMPMVFKLGAATEIFGTVKATNYLTLAIEALHPSNYTERIHIGTEYGFQNHLFLRAGYKFNYDLGGLCGGLGLKWTSAGHSLGIDVSYSDFGVLNSVIRFSLSAEI